MSELPTRTRLIGFYGLSSILSVVIALLIAEAVVGSITYSSGVSVGKSHERWMQENWKPINELGLRDFPLRLRIVDPRPRLYFLGDSFTAGHGVMFEDSFYFQSLDRLGKHYNVFNLSQNGASTLSEAGLLEEFNRQTQGRAHIVVHQYFFNDIEDRITVPERTPPSWLAFLSRYSATAELALAYSIGEGWGGKYIEAIREAYLDQATFSRHWNDVAQLHADIRAQGGKVIFLVFPPLAPDELLHESTELVSVLKESFSRTCKPGDVFLDVSGLARKFPEPERVVNFMNGHPSEALHEETAEAVVTAILGPSGRAGPSQAQECTKPGELTAPDERAGQ